MTVASIDARCVREADRLSEGEAPLRLGPIDYAHTLGRWHNSNRRTWDISRAELTEAEGQVWLHVWATDPVAGDAVDWGSVPVEQFYTDSPRSHRACSYTATFDLGHCRTHLQANVNHGLTVFAAFTTFTDDSGRLSYFSREFFHRSEL